MRAPMPESFFNEDAGLQSSDCNFIKRDCDTVVSLLILQGL